MDFLEKLVSHRNLPDSIESLQTWWQAHTSVQGTPFERAVLGGALSDRLGYAFASGYQAALGALFLLPSDIPGVLSATEDGGAHPRAIQTELSVLPGGFRLNGTKRWSTLAPIAQRFFVVARSGDESGRPKLKVVEVPASKVRLEAGPELPFTPEIPHSSVVLENVSLPKEAVLEGDGYADYLKPFRTVEDIHVHAAALAYLARVGRVSAWSTLEQLYAQLLSLSELAKMPQSAQVHLALAGVLQNFRALLPKVQEDMAKTGGVHHERFLRDMPLLNIAEKVREKRRARARERLGIPD